MAPLVSVAVGAAAAALFLFVRWGTRWGSTPEERARRLPGDAWLEDGPPARHIVSWIPEPRIGDAAPDRLPETPRDRSLPDPWWTPSTRFAGATARAEFDSDLRPDGACTRLVIRMSADAIGPTGGLAMLVYRFIDSIMAIRQLRGIRDRAEQYGARGFDPDHPETGARDQYQLYEVIYASGDSAGVAGSEAANRWRRYVLEEGTRYFRYYCVASRSASGSVGSRAAASSIG